MFCNLFSYAKYQLMLYKALRPEDMETTEADISTVTLETVLINTLYNDLGMMVHGRLLILVEAQSIWSINILARIVMCFAGEWKKYIQNTDQSVYSSMRVSIPKPEFYVIYTGGDKKVTYIDIAIKMLANHEPEAKIQEYTGLSSSDLQDIKD